MMAAPAPVIVFAYNRPNHLGRTLEALAAAERAAQTALWIFCDGPKSGQRDEAIEAVRSVACDPEWEGRFASVSVAISDTNKGLARSIISGVTHVIEQVGSVIVLEDDLIVSPDFLIFLNSSLDFYRDDVRVGMVTGFCPLAAVPPGHEGDVMAVPRNCSHGWATWADRWREIDWGRDPAIRVMRDAELRRRFRSAGSEQPWRLYRHLKGRIDSWSIRVDVWLALTNRYTIYPVHNRIQNIGFDGSGVHTRRGEEVNSQSLDRSRDFSLSHPEPSPAIFRAFRDTYSGGLLRRMMRDLRMWLLAFRGWR